MTVDRKKLGAACIYLGLFFNPCGYDVVFKFVCNLTGSYWGADLTFYIITILFFAASFYFYNINPFKFVHQQVVTKINWTFRAGKKLKNAAIQKTNRTRSNQRSNKN